MVHLPQRDAANQYLHRKASQAGIRLAHQSKACTSGDGAQLAFQRATRRFIVDLTASVVVLDVARTFWEKLTILHAEHHRPEHLPVRDRFARHYSDFCALWLQEQSRAAALVRIDLLADVVLHKGRYFASSWANYDSAVLGTLKLVPPAHRWAAISADYATMRPMFLSEPPPFAELMRVLAEAQAALNTL